MLFVALCNAVQTANRLFLLLLLIVLFVPSDAFKTMYGAQQIDVVLCLLLNNSHKCLLCSCLCAVARSLASRAIPKIDEINETMMKSLCQCVLVYLVCCYLLSFICSLSKHACMSQFHRIHCRWIWLVCSVNAYSSTSHHQIPWKRRQQPPTFQTFCRYCCQIDRSVWIHVTFFWLLP